MKLVDILAVNLKCWPDHMTHLWISAGNTIYVKNGSFEFEMNGGRGKPEDYRTVSVSRAEWQAAVDALNAPKVVEWDGVGDPPVGTVCEYDARPSGKGEPLFVTVEVKYVSDQSIVIICTDVPDGEKKENIGVELALMNGLAIRGKLRPIRTAEQVAAEERKAEILEMIDTFGTDTAIWGRDAVMEICGHLWESGYRKQVAK